MANYREDIVSIDLENGNMHRSFLRHSIGEGDAQANRFGIRAYRNGEPETLTGTCTGQFIRADGVTVELNNGVVSGNMAYVTLINTCYAVEGAFSLAIKMTNGGEIVTLRIVDGMVCRTSTDAAADPGYIIPSVSALITAIQTATSQIPQDYSEMQNEIGTKAAINDLLDTAFVPALFPLDDTGTAVTGKAWKIDKTTIDGTQYKYITYQVPSSYAGNIAIAYGHGWGANYPLISFYDSNMTFISSAGLRGDTQYKGLAVVIPANAATIVINCRPDESYRTGIAFYRLTDFVGAIKKIGTYSRIIDSTIFEEFPEYADVRNLPTNCVYALGASAYEDMTHLPEGLNTYATILKVNGATGGQLAPGSAYNLYLCANEYAVWIGFETNNALSWRLISGNVERTRKYLFIGDSYGDGYSHDGSNSGWCTYLVDELGLTTGEYQSIHQGGSGFNNGGFLARLNAATLENVTDIVVLGGFNDYNATGANIRSAIQTFCNRCRALYPDVTIWIGCVGWIKAGSDPESAYANWQDVRNAITGTVLPAYQNAPKYGAKYLNMAEYLLTDAMMTPSDGYHPGETGNKAIAKGVANGVMTGTVCLPFNSDWKG